MGSTTFEVRLASTPEEREAVYRLRYDVYVGELDRYGDVANHEDRLLIDPEDEVSWLFYVRDGEEVVGTTRITWGPHGFSPRQVEQYQLTRFIDELPASTLAVGERAAIRPEYRGSPVLADLVGGSGEHIAVHDIRVIFGACEPHLLSTYIDIGQHPYADHNVNSPSAGYLVPLVTFFPSPESLRGLGHRADELPSCVQHALQCPGTVTSSSELSDEAYAEQVGRMLGHVVAFAGLDDAEVRQCIARSNVIRCASGDRILRAGGSARNIFVLLDGKLEARDSCGVIGSIEPGEMFGEMAFLTCQPRACHVEAVTEATVLSLSEGTVRKILGGNAVLAAKLLLNVSQVLCGRLAVTG